MKRIILLILILIMLLLNILSNPKKENTVKKETNGVIHIEKKI